MDRKGDKKNQELLAGAMKSASYNMVLQVKSLYPKAELCIKDKYFLSSLVQSPILELFTHY